MLSKYEKHIISNKTDPIKDLVWNLMQDISGMQLENPWDMKQTEQIDEKIPGPVMDLYFIYRKLNDFQFKINGK